MNIMCLYGMKKEIENFCKKVLDKIIILVYTKAIDSKGAVGMRSCSQHLFCLLKAFRLIRYRS